jgi:hypothetical protein
MIDARITAAISRFERLKGIRLPYEKRWNEIREYVALAARYGLAKEDGAMRARKLVDAHGAQAAARLTGVLHGHMINPGTAWAVPKPNKQDLSEEEKKWVDHVQRRMQAWFVSTKSLFATAYSEYLSDLVHYGNALEWLEQKPGVGPLYRAVSIWNCFIDEDEHGRIDTVYRRYELQTIRAAGLYPNSKALQEKAEKDPNAKIEILHIVEPRRKFDETKSSENVVNAPYRDLLIWVDGKELLRDESGHKEFPWAVGRFYKLPDEIYGYGPSEIALPDIKLANAITETVMRTGETAADPPIYMPVGFLLKKVDRRPGAVNYYDATKAAMMRNDPIKNMLQTGDAQLSVALLNIAHEKIDKAYFIDWMTLPDNIAETATAVRERQDLRTQGLSHMVSRQEVEALDPMVNHCFMGLAKLDWFDDPPQGLMDDDEMEFAYSTPLHLAQQRADVDAVNRMIATVQQLEGIKPGSAQRLNVDEIIPYMASRFGMPNDLLTDPAEAQAKDAEAENAAAETQGIQNLQIGASAAQQGAKAIETLGLQPQELGI